MGRNKVKQPQELPLKLKKIRLRIGVAQTEMYELLHPDKVHLAKANRGHISAYETGQRFPPLLEVLKYVEILHQKSGIRISADDLIDDKRKLPF